MLGSGVPVVLVWVLMGWLLAVGLVMALLYASGERDRHEQVRA